MQLRQSSPSPLGQLLREWRARRNLSQLALSFEAEVSARHISFVESGRSQPSREMVLRLASALDLPLRERNALLTAAGYAPVYRETDLAAPEMAQVRHALDFILRQHEPYPSIVMDRHWHILLSNEAGRRLLEVFVDDPTAICPHPPMNALRLTFHPRGLRPYIANWDEVAAALVLRLNRERSLYGEDATLNALLQEILAYPGVPRHLHHPDYSRPLAPYLPLALSRDGLTLSFFTTVTTLGTALDITVQELRIEAYFPADQATETHIRQRERCSEELSTLSDKWQG